MTTTETFLWKDLAEHLDKLPLEEAATSGTFLTPMCIGFWLVLFLFPDLHHSFVP